jgi:predicted esterase
VRTATALCFGIVACARTVDAPAPHPAALHDASVAAPVSADADADAEADVVDVLDVHDAGPIRISAPWGLAFVASTEHPPPIVYLHGMWASPEDSCSYFEPSALAVSGALICPRGNRPASQGGAFGGARADKRRSLDAAITEVTKIAPDLAREGGTLVGFSSGAAFASELAIAEPGRWSGLVLMSMKLDPRPMQWKAAGVKRVLFAAGELDGSHAAMVAAAKKTNAAGLEAKFVSLGKVGHHFAVDMETRMVEAIRWARGD